MAFTVQDLNDLLAILEKHPEWKEGLRQVLLTEDLLRLPHSVHQLIASVDRLTEAVERLNQWQNQVNEQLQQIIEWQKETTQWQKETSQWQKQVNEQLQQLIEWQREMVNWRIETMKWQEATERRLERIERDLGRLKGAEREWYYILRAPAVFGILVFKGHDPRSQVMERLHNAVKEGIITRKELKTLRDADHLWLGEHNGKQVLLLIEVSYSVRYEDLVRAVERAEIAKRIGYNAVPIVAGVEVPDEIWKQARTLNVIVMSDGDTDFDFAEQLISQATQ
ncbi:MAG: hypothetical protein ACUVTP_12320 [Candidatus Fervidibacter sp.]|uniref:hypothetical protein n=1 Tax=Candidatus Fervidibacter sp. TaxID=3100871 RepID=UPI00404AF28E